MNRLDLAATQFILMVFVFLLPVSDLNVWFSLSWANLLNIIYNMSAMYAFLQG